MPRDRRDCCQVVGMRVLLLVMFLLCCGEYQPAVVKVAGSSDPAVVMLHGLFRVLIGRNPTPAERQSLLTGYSAEKRVAFYQNLLDNILQSELYHTEGFFHLHRQRLLITQQGTETFLKNSRRDSEALRLELNDVSHAKNYWQILRYRSRWLNMKHLLLGTCVKWLQQLNSTTDSPISKSYTKRCRKFLQASFDPAIKNYTYSKYPQLHLANIYKPRCCPLQPQQEAICQAVENTYQQLYATDFCTVAQRVPPAPNSPKPPEELWDNDKMLAALSATVALRLSAGHDTWLDTTVATWQLQKTASANFYLKVNVPPRLQGIHASPFWLSQHASSLKNRDLHRARLIYHSWFCEEISPENANKSDPNPLVPAKFAPYFAEDDRHTQEFGSCFNCHKMVQPLANYFGKLSDGIDYQQADIDQKTTIAARFFNLDNPFDRPGGFYDEQQAEFFPFGKQRGMAGLAELLSKLPRTHRCVINSTWNGFFGSKWHLNASEVAQAVQVFAATGFDYRQLLKHLLSNDKAITYFTEGADAFYDMIKLEREAQSLTCAQARANSYGIDAAHIIKNTCGACHNPAGVHAKFMDADKRFALQENSYLQTVYNRVTGQELPVMPQNGVWLNPSAPATFTLQKKLLTCFLEEKATELGVDFTTTNNTQNAAGGTKLLHTIDGVRQ